MSNDQVGFVFDTIIKGVCNASHIDFEESGVDQQTLEELRKGWQDKLSSLQVARFPWDPAQPAAPPPPPPQPQQNPIPPPAATVPSNVPHAPPSSSEEVAVAEQQPPIDTPSQAYTTPAETPGIPAETASEDATLKSEGTLSPQSVPPGGSASAAQRAAQKLHQKYGAAAAPAVQQLQQTQSQQGGSAMSGQQRPQGEQDTNALEQDQKPAPQTQSQPPDQPQNQSPAQSQAQSSLETAQVDGAGDSLAEWRAETARRREAAGQNGAESDHALREHVKSRALLMEGGGVLAPFHERYPRAHAAKPPVAGSNRQVRFSAMDLHAGSEATKEGGASTIARYDGVDDSGLAKDDDEDAINSDLDDPEDVADEDPEDEDSVNQAMLCTYDKVQRVKSKWKCVLKNGILASGGKDYVFEKATGEFEW